MAGTKQGKRVSIEGLTKSYGRAPVLRDVSLAIAPGEFCTFLGASGSGKTTLLKSIAGFEPFERGRILVDGHDMRDVPVERRNIGMVFQHYALFPHMSVRSNVAFGLEMRRRDRREIARRVDDILSLVALEEYGGRMPGELSGGEQQRVALARALVIDPDILVMDEPLGALDRSLRQSIQLEIKQLHRRLGLTVIYVTHDQDEALHLSDRIAILDAGRIIQDGDPREVYLRPRNAFIATFLGECNVFRDDSGREFAVRPEHVTIARAGPGIAAAGRPTATVEAVMFLGSGQKIAARSGDRQVLAIVGLPHGLGDIQPGDAIHYWFDEARVHRFA